jgi:hypothetical protein
MPRQVIGSVLALIMPLVTSVNAQWLKSLTPNIPARLTASLI